MDENQKQQNSSGTFVFKKGDKIAVSNIGISKENINVPAMSFAVETPSAEQADVRQPVAETTAPKTNKAKSDPKQKLSFSEAVLSIVVMLVPIIGLVFAIIWSLSNSIKKPKQTLARCMLGFGILVCLIVSIVYYLLVSNNVVASLASFF